MAAQTKASAAHRPRLKAKGKAKPIPSPLTTWLIDHQASICFTFLTTVLLAHLLLPSLRSQTTRFLLLSYPTSSGRYAIGFDDGALVVSVVLLLTGLRAWFLAAVGAPLAGKLGIASPKDRVRFAEQAWMLTYYALMYPLEVYIYVNSPYFLKLQELWTGFPDRELDALPKAYMLFSLGFWLQQVVVLHIEQRRHDHAQMLTHHFVTIALIIASYAYHQPRVANLIMVQMDIIDLILPLAKCLKYLGFSTLCDVAFGAFVLSWLIPRHIFFPMVCWSVYAQSPISMPPACYYGPADNLAGPLPVPDTTGLSVFDSARWSHLVDPFLNPGSGTVCMTAGVKNTFLSYLLFLEVIMLAWFILIVKVIIRVLNGAGADDVRSDAEEEEGEEEVDDSETDSLDNGKAKMPLEEEVGADEIDFSSWQRRRGVTRSTSAGAASAGSSSGVTIPGHSDRKELLNRIGCEKQID